MNKSDLYAGVVWILSAVALIVFGVMTALHASLPGMEDLIAFLAGIEGRYIYLAAFLSIFVEGLYFIGSFFPGSSLVVVLAILSQAGGVSGFLFTIGLIFAGWCLAGVVNIVFAKVYRSKVAKLSEIAHFDVKDRPWSTWFPSFRATHEVAQVAAGAPLSKVVRSALRVRVWATLFMAAVTLLVPLFFDIKEAGDREGYASIAVVAGISLWIGIKKLRAYRSLN